jgi:hypothetical protein
MFYSLVISFTDVEIKKKDGVEKTKNSQNSNKNQL